MSTSILKALPGKLDIKRHSPSILYIYETYQAVCRFIAVIYIEKYLKFLHAFYDINNWAMTCDFQQCGILTSVDSDKHVQPRLSLDTPNDIQSVA